MSKDFVDMKDYQDVKVLTYKAVIAEYPDVDARAIGVYWFIMAVDLLVGKFNMDKQLMHDIIDEYTYAGDGETVH